MAIPGADIWAMDVARYGDWARPAYTNAKVRENYSRRFSIRFPNEELPAGRPLKTTPIYDLLAAQGRAVRRAPSGWKCRSGLRRTGVKDEFSWRRSTRFRACRRRGADGARAGRPVGDLRFAKYRVTGEGAEAWLDRMLACKLPKPGRMTLAPMLKEDGRLIGDFTVVQSAARRSWYHRRLRHRRTVPHALVRAASARRWVGRRRGARPEARRPVDRRSVGPHGSRKSHPRRCLECRLPLHGDPRHGHRHGAVPGRARQLHRRSRLRDLDGARIPAPCLRDAHGGRRGIRHRPVRLARAQRAPAREELRLLGRASTGRSTGRSKPASTASSPMASRPTSSARRRRSRRSGAAASCACAPSWSTRRTPTSSATSRSGSAARCAAGSRPAATPTMPAQSVALGYVPKEIADESGGFEIEVLGRRLAARLQPAPLFDANFERMRG